MYHGAPAVGQVWHGSHEAAAGRVTGGVVEVDGQTVVVVAVGLCIAMWIGAAMWASAAKRRDAARSGRGRRAGGRRPAGR
jgi:hypothetical protein